MRTRHDPFQIEQRLAHRLRDAEYLLIAVLGLMLWTAGFVDLFTATTPDGPVFGLYSVRAFVVLLAFAAGFAGWGALIVRRDGIARLKGAIAVLQRRPAAGLGATAAAAAILGSLLVWYPWLYYPLLSTAVLLLTAGAVALLLAGRVEDRVPVQPWRKVMMGLFAVIAGFELVLQAAAWTGTLPAGVSNLSGLSVPYGRVYQRAEGRINATTNRYGWPYPAFRLVPGSTRIVLTGDTFVQALQIDPRQHMGVRLEQRLRQRGGRPGTEVLALGFPGYGPGIYADPILYPYTTAPLQPAEVVVVFHTANDLQAIDGPRHEVPYFVLDGSGHAAVHPDDLERQHTLWHAMIPGYDPIHPVTTIKSQLFTLAAIDRWWMQVRRQPPTVPRVALNLDSASEDQPFGRASFAFRTGESAEATRALALARALLRQYRDGLSEHGVRLRLVTLPHFPTALHRAAGAGWPMPMRFGDYDLLRPDRALAAFAAEEGIPFLSIGAYLAARGTGASEARAMFHREGLGHLTPRGHDVVAEALEACFYTERAAPECFAGLASLVREF